MGFYTTYYDAAGSQNSNDPNEFFVVAGLLATERRWSKLGRRWKKALRDFGLTHLHTADLFAGKGDFKGWNRTNNRVDRLFERLAKILKDDIAFGVHMGAKLFDFRKAYDEEEFIRVVAGHDRHGRAGIYSCYGALTLSGVREWASTGVEKGSRILHYFERGDLGWGALKKNLSNLFDEHEMPRDLPKRDTDGSYLVPFQATDFFAWHARRYWQGKFEGTPRDKARSLLIIIEAFPERRTHGLKELKRIAEDHRRKEKQDAQ